MWPGGPVPSVRRTVQAIEGALVKRSLAITLSATILILVLAFAALGVLSAVAGQQSGLDKSRCATQSCDR